MQAKDCICIIPARGGSKRIPKKNIAAFHGKELIYYPIQAALKSELFKAVYVSTDDESIATVARKYGASVLARDEKLADDFTSTIGVMRAIVRDLDAKYFCCLYASAVLINSQILKEAMKCFFKENPSFLFSAGEHNAPIQRAFYLDEHEFVHMFDESKYFSRSQDLQTSYADAGAFYIGSKQSWLNEDIIFNTKAKLYKLEKYQICDIDTPKDLEFAKLLYLFIKNQLKN